MQLAAAMALHNLGAFIFRHHPLDLQQQVVFRALAKLTVSKHHLHTPAAKLLDQNDLIGIFAGQPVGGTDAVVQRRGAFVVTDVCANAQRGTECHLQALVSRHGP